MSRARLVPATAALLAAAIGFAAGARADVLQPLSPEQSTSLERALRLWNEGLQNLDPASHVGVTPADGHYDVTFPLVGWASPKALDSANPSATAQATLDPQGQWHFDQITLPSPVVFDNSSGTSDPSFHITEEFGAQSGSAVIDPTLASPSSGEWRASPVTFRFKSDGPNFLVTIEQMRAQRNINPSSPGRADFASIMTVSGINVGDTAHADAKPGATTTQFDAAVHSMVVTTQSSNMDVDKVMAILPRINDFAGRFASGAKPARLTPDQRSAAHDLLGSMRNLVDEFKQTASMQGLSVTYDGHTSSLDKLIYSLALSAPNGKSDSRLRLELVGLQPSLPAGVPADLIPHHIVFAPSLTGIAADDVFEVIGRLIDTPDAKPDAIATDVEARLAKAPVTAGIDELSFDVGPSQLTAKGAVTVASPQDITGSAHIEASGLDALLSLAATNPMIQQAAPVLVFLKGIGDSQGEHIVWDVAYRDHKLTVNGTDMSALVPSGH